MKRQAVLFLALCLLAPVSGVRASQASSENYSLESAGFGPISVIPITSLGPPQIVNSGPVVQYLADVTAKIAWSTSQTANSIVEYGLTADMGTETGAYTTFGTDHLVALTNLRPQTKYYYRVKSVNKEDLIGASAVGTFTTLSSKGITGVTISAISYDSALVSWQTGGATQSEVDYGTSAAYGSRLADASLSFTTNHTVRLTKLTAGTLYHLRITANDNTGSSVTSSDLSFSTNPDPAVAALVATPTSAHEATITWTTNVPASGIFTYRQDGKTRTISLGASDLQTDHTLQLEDLLDNTTYIMKLVITDANGHQATSDEQKLVMPLDTVAPVVTNLKVSVSKDLVATSSWTTSKLCIGKGALKIKSAGGQGNPTLPEPGSVTDHILVKTGLNPSTLYSLHVSCTDIQGNVGQADVSFITPAVQKSIFSLIAASFAKTFGWASQAFN
jgi:hypothetical protein